MTSAGHALLQLHCRWGAGGGGVGGSAAATVDGSPSTRGHKVHQVRGQLWDLLSGGPHQDMWGWGSFAKAMQDATAKRAESTWEQGRAFEMRTGELALGLEQETDALNKKVLGEVKS
mmetsp:Transcript_79069/g.211306  ORF Transcript_79069/g.211306 Transcript_79069/m.211306 type:complete len:117 (+) Transcript_79069:358-708(+)